MKTKMILLFLVLLLSSSRTVLCTFPLTLVFLEIEKLRMQIETASVEQAVKSRALELLELTESVILSPNQLNPNFSMKQLDIVKCVILLQFPPTEQEEPIATLRGIAALLSKASTATAKPVRRDLPKVDPPAVACNVEIVRLDRDADVLEVAPSRILLKGQYSDVFLAASASEPGSFEWSSTEWIDLSEGNEILTLEHKTFPLEEGPFAPDQKVGSLENGEGLLEIFLTSKGISWQTRVVAHIKVVFTSQDQLRMCEDSISVVWRH